MYVKCSGCAFVYFVSIFLFYIAIFTAFHGATLFIILVAAASRHGYGCDCPLRILRRIVRPVVANPHAVFS